MRSSRYTDTKSKKYDKLKINSDTSLSILLQAGNPPYFQVWGKLGQIKPFVPFDPSTELRTRTNGKYKQPFVVSLSNHTNELTFNKTWLLRRIDFF